MNSALEIAVALTIGVAAGLFHFGGLWWTVKQVNNNHQSAGAFLISFLIRMAVTVATFAFVVKLGFLALTAALTGFLMVRMVLTRTLGPTEARAIVSRSSQEKHHA